LGLLQCEEGHYQQARDRFELALEIFREIGDTSQEMICYNNLGDATRQLGDYENSSGYYRKGLMLAREHRGNREERVVAYLLEGAAMVALDAGNARGAAWILGAANSVRESISARRPPQDQKDLDTDVGQVRAALDSYSFKTAWDEGGTARVDFAISKALELVTETKALRNHHSVSL